MREIFFAALSILLLGHAANADTGPLSMDIDFSLVREKMVLRLKDKHGGNLNIIFDSASNDFLLDSAVVRRLGIKPEPLEWSVASMNGTVKAALFANQEVFESALLNKLYYRGSSLDMRWLSETTGMRIDGMIGLNEYMKITVGIDFGKQSLSFREVPLEQEVDDSYLKIKMLYTNAGFEKPHTEAFKRLPACKVRFAISDSVRIETNLQFDTGFNKKFALLTVLDVDSVLRVVNRPFVKIPKKRVSFGEKLYSNNSLLVDSIFIDNMQENYAAEIIMGEASNMAITGFGRSEWMALCGIGFLKEFKQVYFDLIDWYIYLKPS